MNDNDRCKECGSWDACCSSDTPVSGCGCARCLSVALGKARIEIKSLTESMRAVEDNVGNDAPFTFAEADAEFGANAIDEQWARRAIATAKALDGALALIRRLREELKAKNLRSYNSGLEDGSIRVERLRTVIEDRCPYHFGENREDYPEVTHNYYGKHGWETVKCELTEREREVLNDQA